MLKKPLNVGDVFQLGKLVPSLIPNEEVEAMVVKVFGDTTILEVSFCSVILGNMVLTADNGEEKWAWITA